MSLNKSWHTKNEQVLSKKDKINKLWHLGNRMPKNATTEQKVKWHKKHAIKCGCRPIPNNLKKLV